MASEVNQILKDLQRKGWRLEKTHSGRHRAHHPDGGYVTVAGILKRSGILNCLGDIRRIEKKHESEKHKNLPPPTNEEEIKMTTPAQSEGKNDLFDLVFEQINASEAKMLSAFEALNRRLDTIGTYLKTESDRKVDEESFSRRLKFIEGHLALVLVDGAKVIPFDSERELVEHSKVIQHYGVKNNKQFQTMRNDLKLAIVRIK